MNDDQYADHLADVYLNGITSISNDAGWEGDSIMGRLIEFGEIPLGTGNDQSNLHMIYAIEKLRTEHVLFRQLSHVIWQMLGAYGESDKILALLSRRYYQGENPKTGRAYTIRDRIYNIGHAPVPGPKDDAERMWAAAEKRYRRRVADARKLLLDKMSAGGHNSGKCTSRHSTTCAL